MKIVSLNLNGVRAAARKGVFEWLAAEPADVYCFQEFRAERADLEKNRIAIPDGFHAYFHSAERKGYAGVAIYARREPDAVLDTLGAAEFDAEGRYLEVRFGTLSVVSLYLPSGSSNPERQASKDRFLEFFPEKLREWAASGRDYAVCGDWNIAHTERDLKNWKSNQKNSGFLPHERAWLDGVIGPWGYTDAWRHLHPDGEGDGYTWWSNRGQAYAKNVGWRIDYQMVTQAMAQRLRTAHVYKQQKFSDHAPLIAEYAD
ncbi:MAG: exodeoxyribonuclease III [Nevskiaceae bacterium]|nr:MAG: exodeoxyribonuclease III [Nevskiaceae bacterium]TBR72755.1 MAG: exodeoxyribonuclease III [Nevskiaceae bacterium]